MNPSIRYATAPDGVPTAYVILGAGPPLVVIDTFAQPGIDWRLEVNAEYFEALAAHQRVVVFDWRGSGLSGPATDFSLESFTSDVESVVDQIGLDRFDILASATSCHVALEFTSLHPGRVRRLVLRNPSDKGYGPRAPAGSMGPISHLAATDWEIFTDQYGLRTGGWTERGHQIAEQMRRHWTPGTFASFMDSVDSFDAFPRAPAIRCETLVLRDAAGVEARRQAAVRLAGLLPNCRLELMRGGNRGPEAAQQIEAFLAEAEAGSNTITSEVVRLATAPIGSSSVVILFTDIVESTALTERLGDDAFRARARELDAPLRTLVREASGTPIEGTLLGDGLLATFTSARQAIECAGRCHSAAKEAGLALHAGLHAGDVINEGNNVYGGAVNIAARIRDAAAPGETVVSSTVRELARTSAGVSFNDRGEHMLKGIEDAVRLYLVVARDGPVLA